eukprot:2830801-Amphidinium_carterae.1
MPPEPIHDVLNGVLRLMGRRSVCQSEGCRLVVMVLVTRNYDSSWASMKKFLAGSGAIQRSFCCGSPMQPKVTG